MSLHELSEVAPEDQSPLFRGGPGDVKLGELDSSGGEMRSRSFAVQIARG